MNPKFRASDLRFPRTASEISQRDAEYASAFDPPPESPESAAHTALAVGCILFAIVVITCALFGVLMIPF
jgi:hypothetical protein